MKALMAPSASLVSPSVYLDRQGAVYRNSEHENVLSDENMNVKIADLGNVPLISVPPPLSPSSRTARILDLAASIQSLLRKTILAESVVKEVTGSCKEHLMRKSNVIQVQAPVTVVGDLHGCVLFVPIIFSRVG
ncbi:hypothetical protein JCM8547_003427 [Rhodosporidiobolus lusitaniae]